MTTNEPFQWVSVRICRWYLKMVETRSIFELAFSLDYFAGCISLLLVPPLFVIDVIRWLFTEQASATVDLEPPLQLTRIQRAQKANDIVAEDLTIAELHDEPMVRHAAIAKARKKHRDTMADIMREP